MLNQKIRYALVHRFLRSRRRGSVLEVGSGSLGLGRYYRRIGFTGVDLEFTDYGGARGIAARNMNAIRADARRLPLRDDAYDLVFSLDMVEHLSPPDRPSVIREMVRVARRDVVVAFPCGEAAQEVEFALAARLRSEGKPVPGWLEEHAAIGFPMPEEMDALFDSLGHPWEASWNESLRLYRWIRRAEALGRPGTVLDRIVPFSLLGLLDRKAPPAIRRAYHVRKR
jgi:SAM-dependent methyltransferase